MNCQSVFFGLALGLNLVNGTLAVAQAPQENWLLPARTTITRDPVAVSLIQSALHAMNPQGLPPIADHTLKSSVTEWRGEASMGTLSESSIGISAYSTSTQIENGSLYKSIRSAGMEARQTLDGNPTTIADRRVMEVLPHIPQPLLQEALDNPLTEIEMLSDDPENANVSRMRITLRPKDWKPFMRDLRSASFDVSIAKDTFLLTQVAGVVHSDGNPRHFTPHAYMFSRYQATDGYLIPYLVEELYAGKSSNSFTLQSIAINQGLTSADLK